MTTFYTDVQLVRGRILLRGYKNGKRVQTSLHLKPYLFTPAKDADTAEYKTLDNRPMDKLGFPSVRDARDYVKRYDGVDNYEVAGNVNYIYPWINDSYPGEIEFDAKLIKILNMDIEVESKNGFPVVREANDVVNAITVSVNKGHPHTWALGDWEGDSTTYVKCKSEAELLSRFIQFVEQNDPDIFTGWYVEFFDIPYLVNRITKVLGEDAAKRLSPWKSVLPREVQIYNRTELTYHIGGVAIIDYLPLYKKFTYNQEESYKLDHIAHVVLGERKLDYSEFKDLQELSEKDHQKFIDYNIKDDVLIDRIDEKLNLLQQLITIAYDAKVNFGDVFGTVRPWDVIIHNYLADRNIVVPMAHHRKREAYAGGYVKEPKLGMSKWVVSFDLTSLYPSIIMQYNISPEKIREFVPITVDSILEGTTQPEVLEYLNEQDVCATANGWTWDRDEQGIFPAIVQKLFNERLEYKRKMLEAKRDYEINPSKILENKIARYDNMQKARKIQLNSLYGALGNPYFRFFDRRFAEGITLTGQMTIRYAADRMNAYLNKLLGTDKDYVIAADTDSLYLELDDLVKKIYAGADSHNITNDEIVKFLDKACEEMFLPKLKEIYAEMADLLNVFENKMVMNREAIADKGIWTAKKRYILNVHNNEGIAYAEPKLKMMGIEAVKSSTPASCRDKIKAALKVIMNDTEEDLIKFVDEFREEFKQLPFEDIAFPRGCSNVDKYCNPAGGYIKGTPVHVKGAIIYNTGITKRNLTRSYEPVRDGDKIKFCYLKQPNPFMDSVISAPSMLPREFELEKYFDRDLMFQKAFLDPLTHIVDRIGWRTEEVATLEGLFG